MSVHLTVKPAKKNTLYSSGGWGGGVFVSKIFQTLYDDDLC